MHTQWKFMKKVVTLLAVLAAKTVGHGGFLRGGVSPLEQGSKGRSPSPLFGTFGVEKTALGAFWGPVAALATPTNSSAPPQTHLVSGQGRNVSDEGVKRAVSRRVWPPRRCGNSGTVNIAALKDSTTCAAKDGLVWFHCSALAVRYGGKCGADSAHASHSENEPSMKGLNTIFEYLYLYLKVTYYEYLYLYLNIF